MPHPTLSGLEVAISVCPTLPNTVVSRYVRDVLKDLGHVGPVYLLQFMSEEGELEDALLHVQCKSLPPHCDVLLGQDWLERAQNSNYSSPFVFTDLHSEILSEIDSSADLFSTNRCDVAPIRHRRCSQDLIYEILFSNHHTGVHTSIFHSTIAELRAVMALHGLQTLGLEWRATVMMYLAHFVSGACHQFRHNVPRAAGARDKTGCRVISQGFETAGHLQKYIIQLLIVANSSMISTDDLLLITEALGIPPLERASSRLCRRLHSSLTAFLRCEHQSGKHSVVPLEGFERLSRVQLLALADNHNIPLNPSERLTQTKECLKDAIMGHISDGTCDSSLPAENDSENDTLARHVSILQNLKNRLMIRPLKRLLRTEGINYPESAKLPELRRILTLHIRVLKRRSHTARRTRDRLSQNNASETRRQWPQKASDSLKNKISTLFREATSSDTLSTFVCASCNEDTLISLKEDVALDDAQLSLLKKKFSRSIPTPELYGNNHDIMLLSESVTLSPKGVAIAKLCPECSCFLEKGSIPPLSMANDNYIGAVPECLKDLTMVEEAMIARSRCKSWIVQLKEGPESVHLSTAQRAVKGHVIVFPQEIKSYSSIMPPSLNDIAAPICVLFIGSQKPSREWLREKAKPLIVRRERIREALSWLKSNNPLYQDVEIDHRTLESLPSEDIIPVHVEHVEQTDAISCLTADYTNTQPQPNTDSFEKIVVSNVDSLATSNELRAAAFRHFRERGSSTVQLPHGETPVNEFFDPDLFPRLYPTLFPYGIGGVEDKNRDANVSFKKNIRHLFSLCDRRLQEHHSFMFTVFNLMQRRDVLLHTGLKVRQSHFARTAEAYSSVSQESIATVTNRLSKGDYTTCNSPEEKRVLDLMKDVNVITSHVYGSSASKVEMRNEIRGLTYRFGLPAFYITINPADIYNPLVQFLAGQDINVDALLPDEVPNYHNQSVLIAKNPTIAAKFFDTIMKAFIKCILGCCNEDLSAEGGILGRVTAHYGCVETQGRGSLHCHLV